MFRFAGNVMQIHTTEAPKISKATPLVVLLSLYEIHID